jgi:flagellar biosynthesis protein FlhB
MAWLTGVSALVAGAAWAAARHRFERRIRMTPEEFAEEARSAQSDPKVRMLQQQRRRSAQPTAGAA